MTRMDRFFKKVALAVLWITPIVFLAWGWHDFPYASVDSQYSDISVTHFPNLFYLQQSILKYKTIPLWTPTILSGYPFVASPQSGLHYPPGWLALLFPLPFGINWIIALHLFVGGLGMYELLKSEGMTSAAALFGGIAFQWMPKLIAHYGAGHLTFLCAVPWMPWLLLSVLEARCSFRIATREVCLPLIPGVFLALIFLAAPQWAVYAGAAWIFYLMINYRTNRWNSLVEFAKMLLVQLALAFFLVAPLLLPLLSFSPLSTRTLLTPSDVFEFSLPPTKLLGLIFPDFGGSQEWILYPGAVALVLSFIGLISSARRGKKFWAWTLLLSLLFSLGSSLPFLSALAHLPGMSLLRVPPRAIFLTSISFIALSAYGLDVLIAIPPFRRQKLVNLGLAALVSFGWIAMIGFGVLSQDVAFNILWGAVGLTVASLGVAGILGSRIPPQTGYVFLLAVALVDWGVFCRSVLTFRPRDSVLSEKSAVVEFLLDQDGLFRVYSPSYSIPQQVAAFCGLELADGVDPLQLLAYDAFMDQATGVPRNGYGVTLPPFETGTPELDNAAYTPDPELLGLLNVRFVVSEFDLAVDAFVLRSQNGRSRVYENLRALPRAWVQPSGSAGGVDAEPVSDFLWEPNQITVQADGPGLFVLSEINIPGWIAEIDNHPAPILEPYHLLRGVELESGQHTIVFRYRPVQFFFGVAISWIAVIYLIVDEWKKK